MSNLDINDVVEALKQQIGSLTVDLIVANMALKQSQDEINRLQTELAGPAQIPLLKAAAE